MYICPIHHDETVKICMGRDMGTPKPMGKERIVSVRKNTIISD